MAANINAEIDSNTTKSSGGCCCGDLKINNKGKDKKMNETNEINKTNKTTTVTAPEIVCGGCAGSIKKALGNVAGVADIEVDVATKRVTVKHDENVSREQIADALDRAGYTAV